MREKIINLLKKIIPEKVEIEVTASKDERFGHYSTNVAFKLAKLRGKSLFEIIKPLNSKLQIQKPKLFRKIEVVKPGFINFWLSDKILQESLKEILKKREKYGRSNLGRGKKFQVEFVSANPTGPLTLANGRGGFLGDVIANVLEFAGFRVEREYYINDTGNQIAVLGESLSAALGFNRKRDRSENLYQGAYIKDWAIRHQSLVKKFKNEPKKLGQIAAQDFLKKIKSDLKKAKIHFDRFTSEEKQIFQKKYPEKALAIFRRKKLVFEKDKALWLRTTAFGDDKDRVLITSNGEPTYFFADAGHYLETAKRGFDAKINILGPDHYGYVKRIQAAAQLIGLKKSIVIITQLLRLVSNGKEVKMSKRRGQFATLRELIDEVKLDAARFFFLMVSPDSHLDFDLKLAKERSLKNPVYYTQYAYVRAAHIIQRARLKFKTQNLKLLSTRDDLNLIKKLIQFPEVIEDAAKDYQVHRLTHYGIELARAFHNFYEKERIIGAEPDIAAVRLALVQATVIVFGNLFRLLGISAPKKM